MLKLKSFVLLGISSLITLTGTSTFAAGGLFAEPMLTYESGESTTSYGAPFANSTGTIKGVGLGARLGFHLSEIFFLAADARYAKPQVKDSSFNTDSNATAYNYGPVIGIQVPILGLRVWASSILGGELDPEISNGINMKFTKAQGYRVGAGFHILMLSLNLEYQDSNYGSTTVESAGSTPGNADSISLKNKAYIASLSFPLDF
ncbi:MAG: hypothetical protein H7061_08745 [Bdellovibrionaceae bacterium]|nr:hypothetical protein [Bdellovibrio sp.]